MKSHFTPSKRTALQEAPGSTIPSVIVLIGFMGAGKTHVGTECARLLGWDFVDTDCLIEKKDGRTIPEIFAKDGEARFRQIEQEVIEELSALTNTVVATGGGAPLNVLNAKKFKQMGLVVHLSAQPQSIVNRLGDCIDRPLLAAGGGSTLKLRINAILVKRRSTYRRVSDISVVTDNKEPRQVANEIVERVQILKDVRKSSSVESTQDMLTVSLKERSYPVWIANGLLQLNGAILISEMANNRSVVLVTHPILRAMYAEPLQIQLRSLKVESSIVEIPHGERHKTLSTVCRLYREFAAVGVDRKSLVVAIGGGVLGDIAGFAAASYLRGIRFVQVPTTLLAQVDSSVGGKTGVDLPEGKNLVGAFHQPSMVLLDPQTLQSLPIREIKSGLAEVIKYGIISDSAFFYQTRDELTAILERDSEAIIRAVKKSCEIKAAVVSEDETEQGIRASLNFGHTVGHALESVTKYRRYRHGEAIAIGMVTACIIGNELGITPGEVTGEVSSCLRAAGLPTVFPGDIDTSEILAAMLLDKKTDRGELRFVLVESIGKVQIGVPVNFETVSNAICAQKPGQRL